MSLTANTDDRQNKAYINLQDNAIKMKDRYDTARLNLNDPVRILKSSINSKIRALYKSRRGKLVVVKYTPTIYYIEKVIEPNGLHREFTRVRYWLSDNNNQPELIIKKKEALTRSQ